MKKIITIFINDLILMTTSAFGQTALKEYSAGQAFHLSCPVIVHLG